MKDLKAYFDRIGYDGPQTATEQTLRALQELHPQAIPFENLNPFLEIPVKLDLESLYQKLVHEGRGGYCFEQNLLFKHVLETLGFKVKSLAARVLWNVPEGEIPARGHMLLLVEGEGKTYISDVGFGSSTLTAPLLLETDRTQETPHEPYRFIESKNGDYNLQSMNKEEWKSNDQFDLQEHFLADYKVMNWDLSNHPESHFVTGLVAARPEPGRRYSLRNNVFSIHNSNSETDKREIKSVSGLRNKLEKYFLITLPDKKGIDESLGKLIDEIRKEA